MDVSTLEGHFQLASRIYPENTIRKNYFIAACKSLDYKVDIDAVNDENPYGGTIGIGNSRLDIVLRCSKIFRLHAIFHDAAGYMKGRYNVGPGYCYACRWCPINSCLLGHVTGLSYCLYIKTFI